mgnify:CR=1 FL=1
MACTSLLTTDDALAFLRARNATGLCSDTRRCRGLPDRLRHPALSGRRFPRLGRVQRSEGRAYTPHHTLAG